MIRREVKTLTGSTGAIFSDCRMYRYLLWRVWDTTLPTALLLMMNPSKANEIDDDPTVERQIQRVKMWPKIDFNHTVGGLVVANAFAYIETDSDKLAPLHSSGFDLVGPNNNAIILEAAQSAAVVVCGWGKPGTLGGRDREVLRLLRSNGIKPYALELNQNGTPRHPLYVALKKVPMEMMK